MAFEAKRYNMTKHGPVTPGYSTMFSGETHLAGGLANILLYSPLLYRVSIKRSSKSGLDSNLWLFLHRPLYLIRGGVGGGGSGCGGSCYCLCTVHVPLCITVHLIGARVQPVCIKMQLDKHTRIWSDKIHSRWQMSTNRIFMSFLPALTL